MVELGVMPRLQSQQGGKVSKLFKASLLAIGGAGGEKEANWVLLERETCAGLNRRKRESM